MLGLRVESRVDQLGRSGWASLIGGPVHLMLASPTEVPASARVEGVFPQTLYYFYVEGLEELHARAQALGKSPGPIEQRGYDQREFRLVDPSGHVLVFGEHSPAPRPTGS